MKKVKISILSLLFLTFGAIMFWACSSNDNEETESTVLHSMKIINSDYGFYHNEAIRLYVEQYPDRNIETESFNSILQDMAEIMEDNYPDEFSDIDINTILPYFDDYNSADLYNFEEFWNLYKQDFIDQERFSIYVADFIDDIILSENDYDEIKAKLNVLKSNNELTDRDMTCLEVFESVLDSSNELWFSNNSPLQKSSSSKRCNQQIIISDAGASLMWCWNPAIAVIAGAVSSLITASTGDCD